MKKRGFKQQVKFAEKAITEENKEWYENFVKTQFPARKEEKRKRKKILLSFSSVLAVVFVAVIGIFVTLPKATEPEEEGKFYYAENISSTVAEFAEVNNSIEVIKINASDIYELRAERVYDSISEDVLYYRVQFESEETHETVLLEFYVNPYYPSERTLKNEPTEYVFKGNPLKYDLQITNNDVPFFIHYTAILKIENLEIYIDYEQFSIDEQSNFFEFLEQTIDII